MNTVIAVGRDTDYGGMIVLISRWDDRRPLGEKLRTSYHRTRSASSARINRFIEAREHQADLEPWNVDGHRGTIYSFETTEV